MINLIIGPHMAEIAQPVEGGDDTIEVILNCTQAAKLIEEIAAKLADSIYEIEQ